MIVQDRGDHLVVIRQTDHAVLAGFLARAWGSDLFQSPDAPDSFFLAAREHDNGWSEWEMAPQVDPRTRIPYTFMSIPTEEHMELYRRGIERLAQVDRYAALLVSVHCSGLYDRARATMPGFSAKYVKSSEAHLVGEFLQRLKLQQLKLKVDLRTNPATKGLADDKSLERNTRLLDSLDRLSLFLCLNTGEDATIENVPFQNRGEDVDWELRRIGDSSVELTPYPFRKSRLPVSILARRVPKRLYGDTLDFQKTLASAPYFAVNFFLHEADGASQTQGPIA